MYRGSLWNTNRILAGKSWKIENEKGCCGSILWGWQLDKSDPGSLAMPVFIVITLSGDELLLLAPPNTAHKTGVSHILK